LKDEETKRKYFKAVKNKLEENKTQGEVLAKQRQRIAYVKAAEEVLGCRKGKSKPRISDNTWTTIDKRKVIIITKMDSTFFRKSTRIG
jgi:hypothetical protein